MGGYAHANHITVPPAAALALTLVLAVSASLAGFATYDMPIQTVSDTESVYLFNLDTGKPILDQNAGSPATLPA